MKPRLTQESKVRGWILFDGECSLCRNAARRFTPFLRRHHFDVVPLQTPWVRERLGMSDEELLSEMRLLTAAGLVRGGADALIGIAWQIWWARPLAWCARLPLIGPALRRAYRWMARHRHCLAY